MQDIDIEKDTGPVSNARIAGDIECFAGVVVEVITYRFGTDAARNNSRDGGYPVSVGRNAGRDVIVLVRFFASFPPLPTALAALSIMLQVLCNL